MEKNNQMARHYESQLENLKLENARNRELVKSAFETKQKECDKLKEDNALLLEALKEISNAYDVYAPDLGITNGLMNKVELAIEKAESKNK